MATDPLLSSLRAPCPLPAGSKVYTYARDSGGDTQERSVDEQIRLYDAWAQEHQLVVVQHFHDRARPGSSMVGRDGLEQLLVEARGSTRHADGIIFWSLDRLSRDQLECQFLTSDLRLRGYTLIFLSNDIPDVGDFSHVIEAFYRWKGHEDLVTISRNSKRGLADLVTRKKADGSYQGFAPGIPPRGFVGEPVEIGIKRTGAPRIVQRWVPDPKWWKKCKQAWEMRSDGETVTEIHRRLQLFRALGCYTTFFRNRIYLGILDYGEIHLEGFVEPMINRDTWERVQRINEQRRKRNQYEPRRIASDYLFSGLVFCRKCGAPMRGNVVSGKPGKRYRYYVCTSRARRECDAPSIPCQPIEEAVLQKIEDVILTRDSLRLLADELRRRRQEAGGGIAAGIAELRSQIRAIDKTISNIVRSAEKAVLSDALAGSLQENEELRKQLLLRMAALESAREEEIPPYTDADLDAIAAQLRVALRKAGGRRVLQHLITRIEADRGHASIFYTFPLNDNPAGKGGKGRLRSVSAPGVARTRDPLLRKQVLYPTELRGQSNSTAAYY